MNDTTSNQIILLLIFVITGTIIGILFDFFRIQRKIIKHFDFITYIQDILFWLLSGLIIIFSIMKFTNGELRSYMIFGIIVGVIIYFSIFSKFIMKISIIIIQFFIKILSIILIPIKKIWKIIKKVWKKKDNVV